jgi:hypothetical protein
VVLLPLNLSKPTVAALAAWFAAAGLGLSGPDSVDFGAKVGSARPYPQQTVSVQNSGTRQLHIDEVTFGSSSGDFSLAADGCSHQTLAPLGACSVIVEFHPAFVNGTSIHRDQLGFWSAGQVQRIPLMGTEVSGPASGNPGAGLSVVLLLAIVLFGLAILVVLGVGAVVAVAAIKKGPP